MTDLNWANSNLEDNDLVRRLKDWCPERDVNLKVVDLSSNWISGRGVDALLKHLQANGASVSKLKLHRNQLDDRAAKAIANYLEKQSASWPLIEIHLSDNQITRKGGFTILQAAHDCQCYPLSSKTVSEGGHSRKSLWLRLENNDIEDPGDMIYDATQGGVLMHIERIVGWHSKDLQKLFTRANEAEVHMHYSVLEKKREKGKGEGKGRELEIEKGKGKGKELDKGKGKKLEVEKGKGKGKDVEADKGKGKGKNKSKDKGGSHVDSQYPFTSHDYDGGKAIANGKKSAKHANNIWEHAVESVRSALERCADLPGPSGLDESSAIPRGQAAIEAGALTRALALMGGLLGREGAEMLATHCSSDVNLALVFAELGIGHVAGAPTDMPGQARAVREGAGQFAIKAECQPAALTSLDALLDFICLLGFSEIRGSSSLPQFDDEFTGEAPGR
eukprot:gnl/MRDRNA2_/MRDRNA2_106735_c0_seq1.p1 gnl/MRDRNA2_/MRDRNA2_106735_c0~~gnl/MRDRNA2_/MRDRNA2_106735_c0_seq1.p1  ORF type:complete len:447 (-),score=119.35 gnl/MRDRNA2_/MRDRNA2_106735_c0_seq1:1-1341(-)